jgi:short subunit dehydrogenase-like uncharacterized protein
MKKMMIYGATGYTGRMVAEHAKSAATQVVLAGRSEGALAKRAAEHGVEYRVFALDDADAIDQNLLDISVLLNCAGPFMRTARPLMEASIRNRMHYLDTAAELDSCRLAELLEGDARAAGVMLMPGGGGSVAMLGSLAGNAVLITIWRSTGVPDIETFVHVTGNGFPQGDLSLLPDGPTEDERLANRYQAIVEVTDDQGKVFRSLLDTVNGYSFTAIAVAEAGRRVLAGEARGGFQTPAGLFGNGFAETIADTTIIDL